MRRLPAAPVRPRARIRSTVDAGCSTPTLPKSSRSKQVTISGYRSTFLKILVLWPESGYKNQPQDSPTRIDLSVTTLASSASFATAKPIIRLEQGALLRPGSALAQLALDGRSDDPLIPPQFSAFLSSTPFGPAADEQSHAPMSSRFR